MTITFTLSLAWFSMSAAASAPALGASALSGVTNVAVVGLECSDRNRAFV